MSDKQQTGTGRVMSLDEALAVASYVSRLGYPNKAQLRAQHAALTVIEAATDEVINRFVENSQPQGLAGRSAEAVVMTETVEPGSTGGLTDSDTQSDMKAALEELRRYLPDIVKNAMLVQWREICADTGCHPLDIKPDFEGQEGHLGFEPDHWAQHAGDMVAANVDDFIKNSAALSKLEGGK